MDTEVTVETVVTIVVIIETIRLQAMCTNYSIFLFPNHHFKFFVHSNTGVTVAAGVMIRAPSTTMEDSKIMVARNFIILVLVVGVTEEETVEISGTVEEISETVVTFAVVLREETLVVKY